LITDPNECAGLCPEEYALVGVGAPIGALVDKTITKTVTVYDQPKAASAAGGVALTPWLNRARRGVRLTVRF
jgi:hypothetical protein